MSEVSRKCEKPRNLRFGAVWGSPPYGAHTPDLTGPSYSPSGSEKNSFYSGGIGPHLGEIWNFEIFNITVFEPSLAKSLQKTRNHVNLQICGLVQLKWYYETAQKNWGEGPSQGAGASPKKSPMSNCGIFAQLWCDPYLSAYRPKLQWSSVHLRRSASTPYTPSVKEYPSQEQTPLLIFSTRSVMGHWTQFIFNGPRKLLSSNFDAL